MSRIFGIGPLSDANILVFSVSPKYGRRERVSRPKLNAFVGIINQVLEKHKPAPKKEQPTLKRIIGRLCDEHGFTGAITIVKNFIATAK